MEPAHLAVALTPLAIYLLRLGMLNLLRWPVVKSGAGNIALLGFALCGFVVVGPMALFVPNAAAIAFGPWVWLLMLIFYGLCITLWILLARPRLIVYNATNDPGVAKSLKYLEANVRADGGIYAENSRLKNYETCVALLCLKEANQDGRYDKAIRNAEMYLQKLQLDLGEKKGPSDFEYGCVGYSENGRPDLSNTAFLMDALIAAGNGPDDEAVKKALIFVSRCQNLESEHNTTAFAAKINDGGFYYTVTGEGDSAHDKTAEGGLRSYGSMTYAGLKSMVYAGLKRDDPRVKAATAWLRKHYDLKNNPGMGDAGLYYYYHGQIAGCAWRTAFCRR